MATKSVPGPSGADAGSDWSAMYWFVMGQTGLTDGAKIAFIHLINMCRYRGWTRVTFTKWAAWLGKKSEATGKPDGKAVRRTFDELEAKGWVEITDRQRGRSPVVRPLRNAEDGGPYRPEAGQAQTPRKGMVPEQKGHNARSQKGHSVRSQSGISSMPKQYISTSPSTPAESTVSLLLDKFVSKTTATKLESWGLSLRDRAFCRELASFLGRFDGGHPGAEKALQVALDKADSSTTKSPAGRFRYLLRELTPAEVMDHEERRDPNDFGRPSREL